ncbi:MAG: helix-turn-helix domain-containing protein [Myxococcota bacterium]
MLRTLQSELEGLERVAGAHGQTPPTLREWVELAEAWRIVRCLREAGGNRSAAARMLGIGRRTLYRKIEKLALGPRWAGPACGPKGAPLAADEVSGAV